MNDTEFIEGYEVKSSVWIGDKRVIFAVHYSDQEPHPYMKCTAIPGSVFTRYENAVASSDYLEALKLFADDIKAEAIILETQRRACGLEDTSCMNPADLNPVSWEDNITGKVVAVQEKSLPEAYRDITHQLYLVEGGFGVEARSRGRACYGWDLYSGKPVRIERPDVAGIVPDDKIPEFASKQLAKLRDEKKKDKGREER